MIETAPAGCRPLTPAEFDDIRRLAYDHFGLDLRKGKEELVSARLGRLIREAGFASFEAYCRHVRDDRSGEALAAMIDALTTNYTGFFREPAHFAFLRGTVLPAARAEGGELRIWSAGCATGEEPYSIAMSALEELGPAAAGRVRILATDISTRALAMAARGAYPAERCEGIPPLLQQRCLLRGDGAWRGWRRMRDELRGMVEFRRVNLMEPLERLGAFPLIFCRNVMIYFDRPTREGLVRRLAANLHPGGWLFVGHAESLTGLDHRLEYVQPAVYRKPGASLAPPWERPRR
jgi:chemotaxis protein methyltransferase CheR